MRIVVYDCEIKNAIPTKGQAPLEGITYCGGWGDKAGMGISVIAAYVWDQGYRIFMDDNMDAFKELAQDPETTLVGFNNAVFDDLLIEACLGIPRDDRRSWDLLRALRAARGPAFGVGGPSLEALCLANFLPGKRGQGAMAPILWQRGKLGELVDYALDDVLKTKKLVELALMGELRDHETGRRMSLILPPGAHATVL